MSMYLLLPLVALGANLGLAALAWKGQWQAKGGRPFALFLLAMAMWAGLRLTAIGRMIRAVASDPELATVVGLPSDRAMLIAVAAGSAVAGLAGVLVGYEQNLSPMMGFSGLLVGIVAAIIGGAGSVGGTLLGGFLVGLAMHLGVWNLPTQWQQAIVFIVLIAFLLARPQGILGKRVKTTTI